VAPQGARHCGEPTVGFWLHTDDPNVASTRIRGLQVVQGLRDLGRAVSLFKPSQSCPDILVLGKRYDRASMDHAESLRARHGTRLVLDLCDNHFYYKDPAPQWVRRADALREAVRRVDRVVTASATLAQVVRAEIGDATPVSVIGDALDATPPLGPVTLSQRWSGARMRLFMAAHRVEAGRRLLWFGNHGVGYADGGIQDLAQIAQALHHHHREKPITLTVVSNRQDAYRRHLHGWTLPTLYLPWSGRVFREALASHAVAVIPARINPFTACKTNNRLATAFCNGLAVAADRIPSINEFADLALIDDWHGGLAMLMADAQERQRRIGAAQERLKERYGLEAICAQWATMCDEVAASEPQKRQPISGAETPI
jgi:hypothetical protein